MLKKLYPESFYKSIPYWVELALKLRAEKLRERDDTE